MNLASRIVFKIRRGGIKGFFRYLPHWAAEHYYEWRFGIDTAGYLGLKETGLDGLTELSGAYEPVPYLSLLKALRQIPIRAGHDIFLDYGSGKGRAVIVAAASFPFKKVIGVELSPRLTTVARENVRRASSLFGDTEVELLCADARYYHLPDEVSVVFLYGPFFGEPMRVVVKQIEDSLQRVPRQFSVIYRYPDWTDDPFAKHNAFEMAWEYRGYSEAGERIRIYQCCSVR